ncbi:MAG: DUF72 domain-containing protein [Bacillota bacterium]
MAENAVAYIGTSGYQYKHWQDIFYPKELPQRRWFSFYADHFDTVEINNTFYNLPEPATFEQWAAQAPEGFLYALKFSRYGTHMKKLKDPVEVINNFMERAGLLGKKLGPILVQLPPNWKANPERLKNFLKTVPGNHRFAIEFRDPSWLIDPVFRILEEQGAALCVHDMIKNHPDPVTTDWVYYRYHGIDYGGNYSHQKLAAEADHLAGHLSAGRDVYAYFNNDLEGYAVQNALDLQRYLKNRLS